MYISVSKRSLTKVKKNDIIAIAAIAKEEKLSGVKVIDASIGSYFDENKKLGSVEIVKKALEEFISEDLGYSSVYGNKNYLDNTFEWTFGKYAKEIENKYHVFKGATIGGTGAIYISFRLFLDQGEKVILPDVMWSNYKLIAKKAEIGYKTYSLFNKDNKLNLDSIERNLKSSFKESTTGRVLLVINDPCQNPTGYCMSDEEYDQLFALLEKYSYLGTLTVIFDIAYLSIYEVNGRECALKRKLAEKRASFLPVISFSCSKIFGIYGLRCGALYALCSSIKNRDCIAQAFGSQTRGEVSTPVGSALTAINHVFDSDEKKTELRAQIELNSLQMEARGKFFTEELSKYGIKFYPYISGFFITLIVDDAFEIHYKLREKHMYVIPLTKHQIRLAISGLSIEEGKVLIKELKEAIDND